jgi:hypothetical protein
VHLERCNLNHSLNATEIRIGRRRRGNKWKKFKEDKENIKSE